MMRHKNSPSGEAWIGFPHPIRCTERIPPLFAGWQTLDPCRPPSKPKLTCFAYPEGWVTPWGILRVVAACDPAQTVTLRWLHGARRQCERGRKVVSFGASITALGARSWSLAHPSIRPVAIARKKSWRNLTSLLSWTATVCSAPNLGSDHDLEML